MTKIFKFRWISSVQKSWGKHLNLTYFKLYFWNILKIVEHWSSELFSAHSSKVSAGKIINDYFCNKSSRTDRLNILQCGWNTLKICKFCHRYMENIQNKVGLVANQVKRSKYPEYIHNRRSEKNLSFDINSVAWCGGMGVGNSPQSISQFSFGNFGKILKITTTFRKFFSIIKDKKEITQFYFSIKWPLITWVGVVMQTFFNLIVGYLCFYDIL